MKTEESIFCMQPKYLYIRGIQLLGAWAIKFCVLTFNIFTIIVTVHCFSCTKNVSVPLNRAERARQHQDLQVIKVNQSHYSPKVLSSQIS